MLPVARDEPAAIAAAVSGALQADLLVTTGGASVGDHDLVQQALTEQGFVLDFWQVAMRPGKPLIAGRLANTPVLGLPGNPVSALVCAVLFLLPSLQVLAGLPGAATQTERATLGAAVKANDQRADHLRADLALSAAGGLVATPFPRQDSSLLRLLARASALILRAPNAPALSAGAEVDVIRLDTLGL